MSISRKADVMPAVNTERGTTREKYGSKGDRRFSVTSSRMRGKNRVTQSTELWAKRRKSCRIVLNDIKKQWTKRQDTVSHCTNESVFFDTSRKSFLLCFWEASAKNKPLRDERVQTAYNYPLVMWSCQSLKSSSVPRNFVRWGGGSTNSVEDRGQRK